MTDMSPTTGKLLTPSEREICLLIVSQETAPYSKRAQALLCLDEGITQKESCIITGLALGQLRYALSLFKKEGMAMFPQKVLPQIDTTSELDETVEHEHDAPPEDTEKQSTPAPLSEKTDKPAAPRQKSFEEMSASISELLEKVEAAPEKETKTPKKEKKKKKSAKKKQSSKEKTEKKSKKKDKAPKDVSEKKAKKVKKEISLKELLEKEKGKKKAKKKAKAETAEKKSKKKKKSQKEKK